MLLVEQEKRKTIDTALLAARKRVSSQTGFIHLFHEGDGNRHDAIPLFENMLFVLALFRSRLSDDVLQGKALLGKLLAFEVADQGNFPVYLHEYPSCRSRFLGIELLPVLFFIRRDFYSILGNDLAHQVQECIAKILQVGEAYVGQMSEGARMKWLAAQGRFVPTSLVEPSAAVLADALISLQMQDQMSEHFMYTKFWHEGIAGYIGPYCHELQEGTQPAPTLYDLFMSEVTGNHPTRLLADHPVQIQAALVYPYEVAYQQIHVETHVQVVNTRSPRLVVLWGDVQHLHSLVSHERHCHAEVIREGDSKTVIEFLLPEVIPDEGEGRGELGFFLDLHPDHQIAIDGRLANTFQFGETIQITSKGIHIEICFEMIEGEGVFFGHIIQSNRPRQKMNRGNHRFAAYDWSFFLRTVTRSSHCRIRSCIKIT